MRSTFPVAFLSFIIFCKNIAVQCFHCDFKGFVKHDIDDNMPFYSIYCTLFPLCITPGLCKHLKAFCNTVILYTVTPIMLCWFRHYKRKENECCRKRELCKRDRMQVLLGEGIHASVIERNIFILHCSAHPQKITALSFTSSFIV